MFTYCFFHQGGPITTASFAARNNTWNQTRVTETHWPRPEDPVQLRSEREHLHIYILHHTARQTHSLIQTYIMYTITSCFRSHPALSRAFFNSRRTRLSISEDARSWFDRGLPASDSVWSSLRPLIKDRCNYGHWRPVWRTEHAAWLLSLTRPWKLRLFTGGLWRLQVVASERLVLAKSSMFMCMRCSFCLRACTGACNWAKGRFRRMGLKHFTWTLWQ